MKVLFAGDISFDWVPRPTTWQFLSSLRLRSTVDRKLLTRLNRDASVHGLAAWKRSRAGLLLGKKLASDLDKTVSGSDYFCVNLESCLSARGKPVGGKKYTLRAAPHFVQTLKLAGVTHVCLANNHLLDYGPDALADTCDYLRGAGIEYLGLRSDGSEQSVNGVLGQLADKIVTS